MKTATENYENANIKGEVKKKTEKGLMYISSPREILEIIKKIPKGKVITTPQIANQLAKKHKVDFTCQLTTGIFISIIANYIEEKNIKDVPYWRVVKDKGVLYDHYLRLPSTQANNLAAEGWQIVKRGKKQVSAIDI